VEYRIKDLPQDEKTQQIQKKFVSAEQHEKCEERLTHKVLNHVWSFLKPIQIEYRPKITCSNIQLKTMATPKAPKIVSMVAIILPQ